MRYNKFKYRLMGDRSILIELGDAIAPEINQKVRELYVALEEDPIKGVVEIVPAYRSLLIIYDPFKLNLKKLQDSIEVIKERTKKISFPKPKIMEVPVLYGGEYGPDLKWVAKYHNIRPDEVIQIHTEKIYQIYMIGFMPGFPYMGELPEKLQTPRRETPRTVMPKGSVAIAQRQIGIYPVESPGGWNIIGRTPLNLFNANQSPPSVFGMGDYVKFFSISEDDFRQWRL